MWDLAIINVPKMKGNVLANTWMYFTQETLKTV